MTEDVDRPSHHGVADSEKGVYPNETIRLLHERASCRNFREKKIPSSVMRQVLESGVHAATGGNLQPYSIVRIDRKATNAKLAKLCGDQVWIERAPTNLLFCLDYHRLRRWTELEVAPFTATKSFRHFWIGFQDTVIAAQNICTAADALGLGSVYIGTTLECMRELRKMFKLPDGVVPIVLLCLGYPKRHAKPRRKLGIDIIVHKEKYREPTDEELLAAFEEKYPDVQVEIKEKRLTEIRKACTLAHGKDFAEECIGRIKEQVLISMAQYYFGLHYTAHEMPEDNDDFLEIMKECGYDCFEPWEPHEEE
jgi:FMN reductase [NAD(P)H]